MLLNLTNFSSQPIHEQIIDQILDRIIESDMRPGDELTGIRKLSRQQHVDKTTVTKAYDELERMNVIQSISDKKFIINNVDKEKLLFYSEEKIRKIQFKIEKERINAELESALQIQKDLLPKHLPNNDKVSVSAFSTISKDVGGDFYDIFEIKKETYGILIGDASGKGLPAALLVSQIQAILKSDITHKRSIRQTFNLLNTYLKMNSGAKNFATLFYGILNIHTGLLQYANAGHNFPIILKNSGGVEILKTTGPALGIMLDSVYEERQTVLEENDIMILFTDGLPETMNSKNHQFSEERVLSFFQKNRDFCTDKMIEGINNEISSFRGRKNEIDDTTIMVIKKNKNFLKVGLK